ncbi:hypothetical protein UFOVP699_193 [uncultured Caudovirales phage]|uniref:Uncharacterized protein n=1 Tax=uncultured Caudovirales phage TaxID=2100421 RepID=A0A6J5NKU1_9CAUD|nr:hypothetical protein UFOVP699_193 [uncultured Caudovirales phage]
MEEKATQILGFNGKMISGSKSGYCRSNPDNLAVFNSNVIAMTDKPTKIWYGDLDLTKSLEDLKRLADEIGVEIRVLRETDARFEHESNPQVKRFVLRIEPTGSYELGEFESSYYSHENLTRNEDRD